MKGNGFYRDSEDARRFSYLLESVVSSVLALALVAGALVQVLIQHRTGGPIISWAGIVVGVYIAMRYGQERPGPPRPPRRSDPS